MRKPFIGTAENVREGRQQVKHPEFCWGHIKLEMPSKISKFISRLGSQPGGGIYTSLWVLGGDQGWRYEFLDLILKTVFQVKSLVEIIGACLLLIKVMEKSL